MGDDELRIYDKDPYETPASALDEDVVQVEITDPAAPGHDYVEPSSRRNAVLALLVIAIVFFALKVVLSLAYFDDLAAAYSETEDKTYEQEPTEGDLAAGVYFLASILGALCWLAGFIVMVVWLYRMYRNLYYLAQPEDPAPRYKPGWAVGGWFVPLVNFYRPAQIMNDIFDICALDNEDGENPPAPLLPAGWWGAWVVSFVVSQIALRVENIKLMIASDYLDLVAAVLTFAVVISASRLQIAKHSAVTRAAENQAEPIFSR